ncbi:hypothetical protein [Hymenobacter sp. B1770]|uniref:hypothetical protein n=1 Tax=Hymenobacter sp. B1770 TaxID=1718788 RepID=UPI003CFA7F76
MKIMFIATLVIAMALIGFLYQQLSSTQDALKTSQQRFTDCQQVTFQLQNQLAQVQREARGDTVRSRPQGAGGR